MLHPQYLVILFGLAVRNFSAEVYTSALGRCSGRWIVEIQKTQNETKNNPQLNVCSSLQDICTTPSPITHHNSLLTTHSSLTTHHSSLITPHSSLITPLFITHHSSQLTTHSSLITHHASLITTHSSLITTHSSLITTHSSLITPHKQPQPAKVSHTHYKVRDGVGCSGKQSQATRNDSRGDFVKSKLPASSTQKSIICSKIHDWTRLRVFFFFFAHFYFPASGQAMVTGVVPSPPRFLPSIFIAHRVQQSHSSSIFHRVLLAHALAFSASQFVRKKKSPRIYTGMHSGGFELTNLTYTRLEDHLIRHRGDLVCTTMATARTKRRVSSKVSWGFRGSFQAICVRTQKQCGQGKFVAV